MAKSDIKLYGKITNGDGNLLVSPYFHAGRVRVSVSGGILKMIFIATVRRT